MKKFAAFVLVISFLACNSVAKHKEAIESLSSEWGSTTEAVTAFSQELQQKQAQFGQMSQEMNLDEAQMAAMADEEKKKLMEIKSNFTSHGSSLAGLSKQVFDFVTQWQEKAKDVNALKEGLEAGKLEGDVAAKVSGLQETLKGAGTKLEGWKSELQSIMGKVNNTYNEFKAMMDVG